MITKEIETNRLGNVFEQISPEVPRGTALSKPLTLGSGPIDPHFLRQTEVKISHDICAHICYVFISERPKKAFASLEGIRKVGFSSEEIEEADISKEKFITEKHFLETHKTELLKEYENKFIAIVNNEVVDSDEDFSSLAKRVYKKFGYKDIFMPKVTREPEILRIPTPFFYRKL